MESRIEVQPAGALTPDVAAALDEMRRAAYPPEEAAAWPGRQLEWAGADTRVLVWDAGGRLVAHAGLLLRDARWDDRPVHVGGIGGVVTHPAARRHGFAAAAMVRAVDFFRTQGEVDFGLLVCAPRLLDYYGRLGWQVFGGTLLVRQWGAPEPFTFNHVMTCPVNLPAPVEGVIDLLGPPW